MRLRLRLRALLPRRERRPPVRGTVYMRIAAVKCVCVCVHACVCTHVCVCTQLLSYVRLFVPQWTVVRQAPLSMEFSRREYWSGLSFSSPPS